MSSAIYDNKSGVKSMMVKQVEPMMVTAEGNYVSKKEANSLSSVRLLTSEEMSHVVCEGRKENPIDVCDDSDEDLKCSEKLIKSETRSIDGVDEFAVGSDFDADVVFAEGLEVFNAASNNVNDTDVCEKKCPEMNVPLRLDATDAFIRAKRRMEYSFMDDYSLKMKPFKRLDRPEYEGEYTFTVRVGVDDSNTVEVKDTMTTCKIKKIEDKTYESEE